MTSPAEADSWKKDMLEAAEALRPAVHLVYGWMVSDRALTKIMSEFTVQAHNIGMRLIFAASGREAAVGILLGTLKSDGLPVACKTLDPTMHTGIIAGMEMLGCMDIAKMSEPALWLVDDRRL